MAKKFTGIEHPPASEIAPGLCVVNTWSSMLHKIGIADAAKDLLYEAASIRIKDIEKARLQRADLISRKTKLLWTLPDELADAAVDEQVNRAIAAATRIDGTRIRQLFLNQLDALKKAGILPKDAELTFETGDSPTAYGMTKRDLLIGVRVIFSLNERIMSHMFHLHVEETPPYWHDMSDQQNSGIKSIMEMAVEQGRLDQIMENVPLIGKTWNIMAFYPGYENVQRLRALR